MKRYPQNNSAMRTSQRLLAAFPFVMSELQPEKEEQEDYHLASG